MNLFDVLHRKRVDISLRRESVIDGANIYIVHVEQQAAAGLTHNFLQEVDFRTRTAPELNAWSSTNNLASGFT